VPVSQCWGGQKDFLLRTINLYNILVRAMVDNSLRESIFQSRKNKLVDWELNQQERAYLDNLSYAEFEQMVGRMVSHWFVPVPVNNRYLILPDSSKDTNDHGLTPIKLTNNLVFGNGTHVTTALCLAALDNYLSPGDAVLDLGTGSGILSIAATLQGASRVLALDIDQDSVETARKNARLNCVEKLISVEQGSLHEALLVSSEIEDFDLVIVNILSPVILSLLEQGLSKVLIPGGILVLSGIESFEVPLIERAVLKAGFINLIYQKKESWAVVIAEKRIHNNQ